MLYSSTMTQSALDPAGTAAERIAELFGWMAAGAVVIWLAVVILFLYTLSRERQHSPRAASALIVGGGVIFPIVVLTGVLMVALSLLPDLLARPPGAQQISISGEQWWWRVRYRLPDGEHVELANEIRLPLGEPVDVIVESRDVIHSFWIPSLAGKIDMIPGRRNRLTLEATRPGTFRGVCAEYCGTSHALMRLDAVVLDRDAFRAWLGQQRRPALVTRSRGLDLFLANGCSACHTIRGTPAAGVIGPDLTHVGSRQRLGAGILTNDPHSLGQWIRAPQAIKPDVLMPSFGMLPPDEVRDMAAYLKSLQ